MQHDEMMDATAGRPALPVVAAGSEAASEPVATIPSC
jgi:hypothetical protein